MQRKNAEIEYLRAIAIVMTILNHVQLLFRWNPNEYYFAYLDSWIQLWGGVDLFFCISGYVVSKAFLESFDAARQSGTHWTAAKAFWLRRAYRLLPSSLVWVAVAFVCSIFLNDTGMFASPYFVIRSAASIFTVTANLAEYFGVPLNPNWVYWSLSLEEQFYFLFPFFLLLVPIAWRWRVLLIAIAIQFPLSRSSTSFWWHMRLDALMWGVVIYLFSRTKAYRVFEPTSMVNKPLALVANLVLMGGLVVVPSLLKPLPFHVGLMAIISAILVLMASFGRGYAFPIGPIKPAMLWLGSRSYALYLCHIPAFFITGELWLRWTKASGLPPPSWGYTMKFVVTATILSIIFAELNYRLIETPFREKGAKIARRMTTPTVA